MHRISLYAWGLKSIGIYFVYKLLTKMQMQRFACSKFVGGFCIVSKASKFLLQYLKRYQEMWMVNICLTDLAE